MNSPGLATHDPARCPLCGADNVCAMEEAKRTGQAPGTCWCVNAQFSPELLTQLPAQARNQACICAACVERGGPPD